MKNNNNNAKNKNKKTASRQMSVPKTRYRVVEGKNTPYLQSIKTPYADAGSELGGLFGMPKLGKGIGGFIGHLLGSGDYATNFDGIKQNSLLSNGAVPTFGSGESTIIEHREYIQDIVSSSSANTFVNLVLPINPGQNGTFPWLSDIASNYEEYEILGMVFEYKGMSGVSVNSTNTALGSVILATEYDPTKPAFSTKQAMENYFFAQSARPDSCVMHAVECKGDITPVKRLYTRTGNQVSGTDLRWSDYGNFQIATTGLQGTSVVCGELWVTYKVKLHKPRLPVTVGDGGQIPTGHLNLSGVATSKPLGTAVVSSSGPLALTPSANGLSFSWIGQAQQNYLVVLAITAATSTTLPTFGSLVNLENLLVLNNDTGTFVGTGNTSTVAIVVGTFTCSSTNGPVVCSLQINNTTIVGAATTDLIVTEMDVTLLK